ncbi:hypothetical protein ACFSDD_27970 [Salipiger marinus]|uniref:hypothetical protein n=1 Tax=Salipiger marinus TaxID=555512 RepID=UPI0036457458
MSRSTSIAAIVMKSITYRACLCISSVFLRHQKDIAATKPDKPVHKGLHGLTTRSQAKLITGHHQAAGSGLPCFT